MGFDSKCNRKSLKGIKLRNDSVLQAEVFFFVFLLECILLQWQHLSHKLKAHKVTTNLRKPTKHWGLPPRSLWRGVGATSGTRQTTCSKSPGQRIVSWPSVVEPHINGGTWTEGVEGGQAGHSWAHQGVHQISTCKQPFQGLSRTTYHLLTHAWRPCEQSSYQNHSEAQRVQDSAENPPWEARMAASLVF